MALDLDAILQSHATSSDDDDDDDHLHSVHHRTVDEILLNDSDSDSAASSPSPSYSGTSHIVRPNLSSSNRSLSSPKEQSHDVILTFNGPKTLSNPSVEDVSDSNPISSNFGLINRIRSLDSSSNLFISGANVARPLLPMFGGVRSNAKPGDALAAAAAASRSFPTPHAAAIKSRRVISSGSEEFASKGNAGDSDCVSDSGSAIFEKLDSCNDVLNQINSGVYESDGKLENDNAATWDVSQSARLQNLVSTADDIESKRFREANEVHPLLAISSKVAQETEVAHSSIDCMEGAISSQNICYSDEDNPPSPNDGNNDATVAEFTQEEVSPPPPSSDDCNSEEYSTNVFEERIDQGDKLPSIKGGETDLIGNGSTSVNDALVDFGFGCESGKEDKSHYFMKPLDLAEELEKKHASTGLHLEEGAAAQPMKLEGVAKESTVLGYFDVDDNNIATRTMSSPAFRRDHGLPQVVAVHLNFVAVGMSRGSILLIPSKYSANHPDNMDAKIVILGLQGDRSHSPVTSMCFSPQGDLLFSGYSDGHITVWDVQKASIVKVINEHRAPVVHLLYLGQDYQVTRQFDIVSGDSKGVVKSLRFSVVPWINMISFSKSTHLLDGQTTSTVICASVLLCDEYYSGSLMPGRGSSTVSSGGIGNMMGGVVGGDAGRKIFEGSSSLEEGVVVFVTHQSALVAKIVPDVKVYAQLPKPEGVRDGAMPYAAWKCMAPIQGSSTGNPSFETSERVSLLGIVWDRMVQVAKLVKSELKVCWKWTLESSGVGIAWLSDQVLVILTENGQLCLFATDGSVIHQTTFSVDGSQRNDLVSYHSLFSNNSGNLEKAYHNSVASRGASVYILGPMHLVVSRLLPWKERIEVLRKAGDWMGALNMAMTLFDGQAHGIIDLPGKLDDVQQTIIAYLVELLLSYVDEVFSYISVVFGNQIKELDPLDDTENSDSVHSEIKEQFIRVGGVAVEFCVHIKRVDVLFDEILSRFVSVKRKETFLELLEPYILKDMLGSLPPEIMQELVEHYSRKGWLLRVEQCVLHMNISSLDFNQVVRICREHRLYGALIYLFNKGLDDFKTPLEELLIVLRSSPRESASSLGYRMLVYLKYCFQGLAFPPGHGALPSSRLPSLREELVKFLLEDSSSSNSLLDSSLPASKVYPNLYYLLKVDTQATLDVLRFAFVNEELSRPEYSLNGSVISSPDDVGINNMMLESQNLVQDMALVLSCIFNMDSLSADMFARNDDSADTWPSKEDLCYILEFISSYVACGRANVARQILSQILEYLTSGRNVMSSSNSQNVNSAKTKEKRVLAILKAVAETDWDASYLLDLCVKAEFYLVCGFIHAFRCQYIAALDSYMRNADEPIHVFLFIEDMLQQLRENELEDFRSAVISRFPNLIKLSRVCGFFLIVDHFNGESQQILSHLHSSPESLFLYLRTLIEVHSGSTLNLSCLRKGEIIDCSSGIKITDQSERVKTYLDRIVGFPRSLRNNPVQLTDEMIELYIELLCRYECNSVLEFLETFENYRVDYCLRLCQDYKIFDAAAFLLERVGDVGSALSLTLSCLDDKFSMLDAAVRNVIADVGGEYLDTLLRKEEVTDILNVVHDCIGLCQRNSPRLKPDESEFLWFQLLDFFCQPLMDSCNGAVVSENVKPMERLSDSFDKQEGKIKWKVPRSRKGTRILRKLFHVFIKEIVEGMIGHVRLPTIMSKLLSENGSQEFGDFKPTILGMLGNYDFEKRILDTARSLIEDDTFYTMSILRRGASYGYAPRSLQCCMCGCPFIKDSSNSSIKIFNCGHASHLRCDLQENGASLKNTSAGCPICIPKNTKGSRSKSVSSENGLVNGALSKSRHSRGTIFSLPHDSDAFGSTYGLSSISRFELLTNLQTDRRSIHMETIPQLRLAPPTVYHEKVKKGIGLLVGESSSSSVSKVEKSSKSKRLKDIKVKGSSLRFPLKSNIFGKEKTIKP